MPRPDIEVESDFDSTDDEFDSENDEASDEADPFEVLSAAEERVGTPIYFWRRS